MVFNLKKKKKYYKATSQEVISPPRTQLYLLSTLVMPKSLFSGTFSSSLVQAALEMEGSWQLGLPFPVLMGSPVHAEILNGRKRRQTKGLVRKSVFQNHKPLKGKRQSWGLFVMFLGLNGNSPGPTQPPANTACPPSRLRAPDTLVLPHPRVS